MSTDWVGSLTFGGSVDGSCEIDTHMSLDVATQSALAFTGALTGTFCGYDIQDIATAQP